ncbi:Anamorsin [Nymphon striatum]|nr:Anamorsin [Nymphon striatum]
MEMENLESKQVMLLWTTGTDQDSFKTFVEKMRNDVGSLGKVLLENIDRLGMINMMPSSRDVIIAGQASKSSFTKLSPDSLEMIVNFLKPDGVFVLREPSVGNDGNKKIKSKLTLSGFVDIQEIKEVSVTDDDLNKIKTDLECGNESIRVVEVRCKKPSYDIGSQAPLKLNLPVNSTNSNVQQVWSLSTSDTFEDDLVDEDQLLDEQDRKKPDAQSLKIVCNPNNKKKKACKDCSCGLADEQSGQPIDTSKVKSSCGSCYLGDAFRCASCPYMGLPAFKSGEKILLTGNQLQADV